MDRLERLVNLVAALLEAKDPLTRDQVQARVGGYSPDQENFRRNFERDKDLLRQMGIPVVVESLDDRHPEGSLGYRIPQERYQLADPQLTDDELAALHLAASAVDVEGAWGRSAATTALWKLAAAGGPGRAEEASPGSTQAVAPPALSLNLPAGERVARLFGAVAERRQVEFTYHGTKRTVDPWRLSYRTGQWYLAGFDHHRRASRTFRLDRLEADPDPVGEPGAFRRPPGAAALPPPPWQLGDDPEVVASVAVDPGHAHYAVASAGPGAGVEHRSGGAVVLTLTVTNREAFRTFVLGFLDHAELLGPPELVADLVGWLEQVERSAGAGTGAVAVPAAPA